MSVAPQALVAAGAALAALAGCAPGVVKGRTTPLVEVGFGAGVRVPAAEDDESPLVSGSLSIGAVRWWSRDEGPLSQHMGVGFVLDATWFDLERADLGGDLVLAPPRHDRRTGFQFRIGTRLETAGDALTTGIAAEWSDSQVGALFASATWDFFGDEAAFLFGARVNLLFPVTYVRATPLVLD